MNRSSWAGKCSHHHFSLYLKGRITYLSLSVFHRIRYGGQNGARRLRSRNSVSDAYRRFRLSLGSTAVKNFTDLEDNNDFRTNPFLCYNPSRPADMIASINEGDSDAFAVAYSPYLKDLTPISDTICENLKGIFLFGTIKVSAENLLTFIRRTPNLESVTMASADDYDADFLQQLFKEGLLPNLKFLEVSHAHDDVIAAMVTAPILQEIVFRWPDPAVTDVGFKRLVDAGGAMELKRIQVSRILIDDHSGTPKLKRSNAFVTLVGGSPRERLVQKPLAKLPQFHAPQVCRWTRSPSPQHVRGTKGWRPQATR